MDVNLAETASPVEILWTMVALPGLVFSIYVFWLFMGDLIKIYTEGINGLRRLTAWLFVFIVMAIMISIFVDFIVGIIALFIPPQDETNPISPLSVVVTVAFIINDFVLSIVSIVMFTIRRRITKYRTIHELEENLEPK